MDGQLFDAARNGDVVALSALLDKHPEKLHVRAKDVMMEKIRAMTSAELTSAVRGHRPPRGGSMDLVALLALRRVERKPRSPAQLR